MHAHTAAKPHVVYALAPPVYLACADLRQPLHLAGYQALLMAPTELLAEQHYETLLSLAENMPISRRPRVELVVASIKQKVRAWAGPT